MKKFLFPAALIILAACNSNQPAATEPVKMATDSVVQDIVSPFPVSYSSKFAMGNPKNAENILTLWKDFADGNLSAHKELIADSLQFYAADGYVMHEGRDSALKDFQAFRNGFKALVLRVDAVTTVRSTDKNEDWVLIWGVQTTTQKNGKVDSVKLMETWRLNKDGKSDLVFQYKMQFAPHKK